MSTNALYLTKIFSRLKETSRLGHGYLFFGESRATRRDFCLGLLRFLEKGVWSGEEILLESLEIPKTDGTLGIEAVREAIRFLWQTPFASPYRVIFLDGDAMTPEAQNALLKTAEEPPARGIILVGAQTPETLVTPLASRLEKFYISPAISSPSPLSPRGRVGVGDDLAKKFLLADAKARKDITKAVASDERAEAVSEFVEALLIECRRDSLKNFSLMREILNRWTKINDFNTNKKLQLETLIPL